MTPTQKVFAVVASLSVLGFVIELVRRRKLREEYAWLWLLASGAMVTLALWYSLIVWLTQVIGAVTPTTTLFIFGLLFLVVISVHFSVVVSRLSQQVRRLAQELAMLDAERQNPKPPPDGVA